MLETINAALKEAILAQDKRKMSTLRLILAAIKDRAIAAKTAGEAGLSEDQMLQILAKMVKQRNESAQTYEEAGRLELAEQEREEIVIIKSFLPRQLDEAATREACAKVIEELGASGLRDMGKIMGALKERYAGQMDFGNASKIVKDLLM